MDESLLYDGSGLFSGYDFSKEALGFFCAAGHTIATNPLVVAQDVLSCIYGELNLAAVFDAGDRSAFSSIESLAHLFTLNNDFFCVPRSSSVKYYAIVLDSSKSDRTILANAILNAFAKGTKDYLVILFRHEEMCMLSFARRFGMNTSCFSDWFGKSEFLEFVRKSDIGNLSSKTGCEFFADFVYMTARNYYIRPLSRDCIHAEWYMLDEDERTPWKDYVAERLREDVKAYGDDYVDVLIDKEYQTDSIDSKDFEFDLLALEIELEMMEDSQVFETDDDDYDDDFDEDDEFDPERINTDNIPLEILNDPVELLKWLNKNAQSLDDR
jgi:hypothetical protein